MAKTDQQDNKKNILYVGSVFFVIIACMVSIVKLFEDPDCNNYFVAVICFGLPIVLFLTQVMVLLESLYQNSLLKIILPLPLAADYIYTDYKKQMGTVLIEFLFAITIGITVGVGSKSVINGVLSSIYSLFFAIMLRQAADIIALKMQRFWLTFGAYLLFIINSCFFLLSMILIASKGYPAVLHLLSVLVEVNFLPSYSAYFLLTGIVLFIFLAYFFNKYATATAQREIKRDDLLAAAFLPRVSSSVSKSKNLFFYCPQHPFVHRLIFLFQLRYGYYYVRKLIIGMIISILIVVPGVLLLFHSAISGWLLLTFVSVLLFIYIGNWTRGIGMGAPEHLFRLPVNTWEYDLIGLLITSILYCMSGFMTILLMMIYTCQDVWTPVFVEFFQGWLLILMLVFIFSSESEIGTGNALKLFFHKLFRFCYYMFVTLPLLIGVVGSFAIMGQGKGVFFKGGIVVTGVKILVSPICAVLYPKDFNRLSAILDSDTLPEVDFVLSTINNSVSAVFLIPNSALQPFIWGLFIFIVAFLTYYSFCYKRKLSHGCFISIRQPGEGLQLKPGTTGR